MFDLEYKGGNTVVIATKKSKLITDPAQSIVGLKDIEPKSMIALATEARFAVHSDDSVLEVEGPGEYEVGRSRGLFHPWYPSPASPRH